MFSGLVFRKLKVGTELSDFERAWQSGECELEDVEPGVIYATVKEKGKL